MKILLCLCSNFLSFYFLKIFFCMRSWTASTLALFHFIISYFLLWRLFVRFFILFLIFSSPNIVTWLLNSFRRCINHHLFILCFRSLRSIVLFIWRWKLVSIVLFFFNLLRHNLESMLIIFLLKFLRRDHILLS